MASLTLPSQDLNLWEAFHSSRPDMQPRIKDIVEQSTNTLVEVLLTTILSNLTLNHPKIASELPADSLPKFIEWHNELLNLLLNFKRMASRHLADFKYNIGTSKGTDKLFVKLDSVTESIKTNNTVGEILANSSRLSGFFAGVSQILHPNSEANVSFTHNFCLNAPSTRSARDSGSVPRIQVIPPETLNASKPSSHSNSRHPSQPQSLHNSNHPSIPHPLQTSSIISLNSQECANTLFELRSDRDKVPGAGCSLVNSQDTVHSVTAPPAPAKAAKDYHRYGKDSSAINYRKRDKERFARTQQTAAQEETQKTESNKENQYTQPAQQLKQPSIDKPKDLPIDLPVEPDSITIKLPAPTTSERLHRLLPEDEVQDYTVCKEIIEEKLTVKYTDSNGQIREYVEDFTQVVEEKKISSYYQSRSDAPQQVNHHFDIPTTQHLMHEHNFLSNTSEQNKLLKNFSTFSNINGAGENSHKDPNTHIQNDLSKRRSVLSEHSRSCKSESDPVAAALKSRKAELNFHSSSSDILPIQVPSCSITLQPDSSQSSKDSKRLFIDPQIAQGRLEIHVPRDRHGNIFKEQEDSNSLPAYIPSSLNREDEEEEIARPTTPTRVQCEQNRIQSSTPTLVKCPPEPVPHLPPQHPPNPLMETSSTEFRLNCEDAIQFDTKIFLQHKKAEKLHVNIQGLEKITLSNNGKFALFGGKGLHVLDMRSDKFRIVRNDKHESRQIVT